MGEGGEGAGGRARYEGLDLSFPSWNSQKQPNTSVRIVSWSLHMGPSLGFWGVVGGRGRGGVGLEGMQKKEIDSGETLIQQSAYISELVKEGKEP